MQLEPLKPLEPLELLLPLTFTNQSQLNSALKPFEFCVNTTRI